MSQVQALADRIYALAEKLGQEPSTLSRKLLGSGVRLGEIANGSDLTMDTYNRVEREVSELERGKAA
jgi:hypothetical protein